MIELIFTYGKNNKQVMVRSGEPYGYELCFPRNKDGKEIFEAAKYPSTLENACQRVMELKIRESDIRTLKQLKEAIEIARAEIISVLRPAITA